ncbi:hypothetical protein [Sphingomonas crocodyli]|uniref:Uncharacterized protein n=1 Tax=Sphingomonas crocodyli TaxID=1979270 RepID=A0A437LXP9_9SPHN|nr:hypothetical protein [Sphingomonas crocodyli]RVT90132.1 hypothetical protein EOD43_17640 [Sphingomonas crocodyli]
MYVEKAWTAPNGAACTVHRVQSVIVEGGRNIAAVNAYNAPEQQLIGWQKRRPVPYSAFFSAGGPVMTVIAYLISEEGPPAGGVIRDAPPREKKARRAVRSAGQGSSRKRKAAASGEHVPRKKAPKDGPPTGISGPIVGVLFLGHLSKPSTVKKFSLLRRG